MAGQVTAISAGKTGPFMADALLEQYVLPCLVVPRLICKYEDTHVKTVRMSGSVKGLEKAHKIAESLFSLVALSSCNKYYKKKLQPKKLKLVREIIQILAPLSKSEAGNFAIPWAIGTGTFQDVLKVYFFYNREALRIKNPDDKSRPFDDAVCAIDEYRSPSFVALLLHIDKELVGQGNRSLTYPAQNKDRKIGERLLRQEKESQSPEYDFPSFNQGMIVKAMLLKHAKELNLDKEKMGFANQDPDLSADATSTKRRSSKLKADLSRNEKELELTSLKKPQVPAQTPSSAQNKTLKPNSSLRWQDSFCKALMYILTCRWVYDLIKYLRKSFLKLTHS